MARNSCECAEPTIDHDSANGIAFCTTCGTVLEENTIVAEVQFVEGGDGRHMALGSRVSATGRNSGHPYGRTSSDSSTLVARQTILQFATALNCNVENVVEVAHRIYTVTHSQGLTKGRQVARVCAVCLYIALRKEGTPVMLIEFADLLKVSVFKLGTLFMLIRRQFPDDAEVLEIDPSIYIARFAAMLHFGSKTKDVVNDAMKLVRRMKRDWLADGRRPAGICGACLVIAARMHNFHRSVQEIVNIVKMSGVTVKTRLNEFKKTSAANLSTHEFRVHYDCNDVDTPWPPCTKDPRPRKRKRSSTSSTDEKFPETPITSVVESGLKVSLEEETPEEQEKEKEIHVPKENGSDRSTVAKEGQKDQPKVGFNSSSFSSRFTSEVLSLSSSIQPPIDDASLSDLDDDDDIINMLVSPEEASLRASVWYGLNREYLLEQKDREARKSQTKPRLPKPKDPPASNVMEAVHRVAIKNISTKINKSILSQLFQTNQMEPSTVAPAAESGLPNSRYPVPTFEGEHTDMYEVEEEYEEEEDYDEENGTTSGIPNIYELVYDVL